MIAGLQALRGIEQVSAVTIVAEVGPLSRFPRPKQLMGYSGKVSSDDSTGDSVRRGAITKTGNAHLRQLLDYHRPKGMALRAVERWPAPNLAYDPPTERAVRYGSLNTTIVGAPGFLSTQKFDGLPEAAAMSCFPPTA